MLESMLDKSILQSHMNCRLVRNTILLTLLLCLTNSPKVSGQFINVQIDVEPDVEASVVRNLDFGATPTGSGQRDISLGDMDMGIFSIRAIETQRLLISLQQPTHLQHESLDTRIPLHLELAYTDFGINDYSQAREIRGNSEEVVIQPIPGNLTTVWSSAHIYVYGWIDIGNVPEGLYTAEVTLHIEYE